MVKLLLIDMPFSAPLIPSIGLGCIEAWLKQNNNEIQVDIFYAKLLLLEQIGMDLYDEIFSRGGLSISVLNAMFELDHKNDFAKLNKYCKRYPLLTGDLIFSDYFYEEPSNAYAFLDEEQNNKIFLIKEQLPSFFSKCEQFISEYNPDMVGFTSMFEQHMASLCLAKKISVMLPNCPIIFGGANCDGAMGNFWALKYSFIHTVISGEGEYAMDILVKEYLSCGNIEKYRGVLTGETFKDMNRSLLCNYGSFFNQLNMYYSQIDPIYTPIIPINLSRGCWWGEKNKCTFCGQNGSTTHFRCKNVDKSLFELEYYHKKYKDYPIILSDNILDNELLRTGLSGQLQNGFGHVFCEIKANLRRSDLISLKNCGFDIIQPGIESLSSISLKRMNKGLTMLQIISFLRNCEELKIRPIWNYLYGFPGEKSIEYIDMIPIIKKIYHLRPPLGGGIIELHRFSEYYDFSEKYDISNIRPYFMYPIVYRDYTYEELNDIAYCFDYEMSNRLSEDEYQLFDHILSEWKYAYKHSYMKYIPDKRLIIDGRCEKNRTISLKDIHVQILDCCDEIVSFQKIIDTLDGLYQKIDIDKGIQYLLFHDILISENNNVVSIVWRENDESFTS